MNVAVNQVLGVEPFHERQKGLEPPMRLVGLVVDSPGRGVGQKNVQVAPVNESVPPQTGSQFEDPQHHLKLRKLMFSFIVPHRAAQPGDKELAVPVMAVLKKRRTHGVALLEGVFHVPHLVWELALIEVQLPKVVVAVDKQEGNIQRADDEAVVFKGKVTGPKHQFDLAEPFLDLRAVHQGIDVVGNAEHLHRRHPSVRFSKAWSWSFPTSS